MSDGDDSSLHVLRALAAPRGAAAGGPADDADYGLPVALLSPAAHGAAARRPSAASSAGGAGLAPRVGRRCIPQPVHEAFRRGDAAAAAYTAPRGCLLRGLRRRHHAGVLAARRRRRLVRVEGGDAAAATAARGGGRVRVREFAAGPRVSGCRSRDGVRCLGTQRGAARDGARD
eukprot:2145968-Rhodomonas_salina.1